MDLELRHGRALLDLDDARVDLEVAQRRLDLARGAFEHIAVHRVDDVQRVEQLAQNPDPVQGHFIHQ